MAVSPMPAGMWTASDMANRWRESGARAASSKTRGARSVHTSQSASATMKASDHDSRRPAYA
jgi:hypothetical protein